MSPTCLIVVPTLNEASHVGPLLEHLLVEALAMDAQVVVADGGSADGTQAIAAEIATHNLRLSLIHNPKRIQSAAMNLAVNQFGADTDFVIRIDAHGKYPADYCRVLVTQAELLDMDSIVVPMTTVGQGTFQRAVATAQNSLVGTGGSAHRTGKIAQQVDHGHHALMRISAFLAVGGYDESFRFNEDAELDFRLGEAGYRVWLTDGTGMTYFPRSTASGLFRQYFGYGGGRARNILKHRMKPRLRQMMPLAILPAVLLAGLSIVHWSFLIPMVAWSLACLGLGAVAAQQHAKDYGLPMMQAPLVGVAAMIMHFAWSSGFWMHLARTATSRNGLA
ncbi:glycosyltransferase family 2 protein [Devosia algicola]|uniref:Glycosyltransferase family 2 protein n=1 Tax=Devosia algicola TaxID=3026418 RepID=A0ABY7YQL2_9HYPH|nr:glycosyltransferase family 2 protein [Devosia algicola]WDR03544.1 glycosyltransferase family 2 protein [Devosia algicola]